jgi:hypothetical protein
LRDRPKVVGGCGAIAEEFEIRRYLATRDAVDLLHAPADLGHREVLVVIVDGFELAAVERNKGLPTKRFRRVLPLGVPWR